ncbi:macrolide ABC transporter ATP-binding protein [bacterium]|nr:macrolide ABC transporter ATP-binding protein [bacterium]
MALIEVNDLEKTYFGEEVETRVLHGLTFDIKEGEFVTIMGPSGSGKSTLMHILGFLDRLTGGRYIFDGKNVDTFSDKELALLRGEQIGFVFQAFNLLPRTTLFENVKLPLTYIKRRGSMKDRVESVLESVGLSHRLHYYTNQISGGEQQRAAIARALVNEPSVVFADEPTGNLDSKSGAQVIEVLQKLNDAGTTIILVTHDGNLAKSAKRIIHIKDGLITTDSEVKHRRIARDGEIHISE